MTYSDYRSKIKSGDILAWSHRGWSSFYDIQIQIVRMATRSEYSHVGVAWVVADRVFVIEAVAPQIRIFPLSKLTPFYWIPCGKKYWSKDIEEFALSKVGEEYSKIQAIKSFFNQIKAGEDSKWQCAEFINTLLINGNVLTPNETLSTPTNIVDTLLNKGYTIQKIL